MARLPGGASWERFWAGTTINLGPSASGKIHLYLNLRLHLAAIFFTRFCDCWLPQINQIVHIRSQS